MKPKSTTPYLVTGSVIFLSVMYFLFRYIPEGQTPRWVLISLYFAFFAWRWGRREGGTGKFEATSAEVRLGERIALWMAVYAAIVALIAWIIDMHALPTWLRVCGALSLAAPIGGVIGALLRYLVDEPDEFQRLLMTRAVLGASGLTLFVLTAWGSLEVYVDAPHFAVEFVTPFFFFMFAATSVWVRRRYA